MIDANFKSGFVSILGKPNAGKSTLMNQLVGERLSIITPKAQTTRHRIMGIVNGENFQIIFSDTPGIVKPKYQLHEQMMNFVQGSLQDADVLLLVIDINELLEQEELIEKVKRMEQVPLFVLLNKVDTVQQEQVVVHLESLKETFPTAREIIPISALHSFNVQRIFEDILELLPKHPPYYPDDQLTDKPERFFVAELIRERIFENYKQEVPYATEVVVEQFKEAEDIIRISAVIYVERESQKGIIIGKGGEQLKKVGMQARKLMEDFFQKKIFLEQRVKVDTNWRTDKKKLERFGY